MNWLARLFRPRQPALPTPQAPAPLQTPDPGRAEAAPPAVEGAQFLTWLLDCAAPTVEPLSGTELQALAVLDKVLALNALPDDLLPRAAAVIPQLLALLRQSDLPVPALTQRVAKDVVLAAEVLRLASSPYYRTQGDVTDLAQAIMLIGVEGLQWAIARVVLKPLFDAPAGKLGARAASRLWEHADVLAGQASALAAEAGLAAFDGYLVGLLHDSGWIVVLRLLDRSGTTLGLPPSQAFVDASSERAHRLFGLAAQRWAITPAFETFGADARQRALAGSLHPLAAPLARALRATMAQLAPVPGNGGG